MILTMGLPVNVKEWWSNPNYTWNHLDLTHLPIKMKNYTRNHLNATLLLVQCPGLFVQLNARLFEEEDKWQEKSRWPVLFNLFFIVVVFEDWFLQFLLDGIILFSSFRYLIISFLKMRIEFLIDVLFERWVKFQEDVDSSGRWSKPYVPSYPLSHFSLLQVYKWKRRYL